MDPTIMAKSAQRNSNTSLHAKKVIWLARQKKKVEKIMKVGGMFPCEEFTRI
jgi:hypothetical protein